MSSDQEKFELVRKIHEEAFRIRCEVLEGGMLPVKAHPEDAGFDLYATESITLYPGQVIKHPLNIKLHLPKGCYGRVESRSGLGSKGMLVYAGIIDELYRGIPHVVATNVYLISGIDQDGFPLMRTEPIVIKKGDRLAQIIVHPYSSQYYIEQVDKIDTNTARSGAGFGSSGQ